MIPFAAPLAALVAASSSGSGASLPEALGLGVLQGFTEFLPVSSSGHLALAERLFGIQEGGLTLNVLLHGGTLGATVIVLRRRLLGAITDALGAVTEPTRFTTTVGGKDALAVLLATLPTGVIGLLLHDSVERFTTSPLAVGVGLVVTTAMLISTRFLPGGDEDGPPWWGALLLGVAQGLAVVPGISRSGSTIVVALWLGMKPARAFELSMLMSLPAVAGALLLEARKLSSFAGLGGASAGAVVALVTGVLAMWLLRGVVVKGRLAAFAAWTGPAAVLAFLLARS